jgi:hypothetical protein
LTSIEAYAALTTLPNHCEHDWVHCRDVAPFSSGRQASTPAYTEEGQAELSDIDNDANGSNDDTSWLFCLMRGALPQESADLHIFRFEAGLID